MEPIGTLHDRGPYSAWLLNARPNWQVWGISGAGGWTCWGLNGAVHFSSAEAAEFVIRSHGHEPGPRRIDPKEAAQLAAIQKEKETT